MTDRGNLTLRWRFASSDDAPALAALNEQLIADEGHRNPMKRPQLERRMRGWLASEYRAVLIELATRTVAYALYRDDEWGRIHLRQFFVARDVRRRGVGKQALRLFREAVVPGRRVLVEVLMHNEAGKAFWIASGFREHALTLELPADAP